MDRTIYITGPEPDLELQASDVWLPELYSRRILCFELPDESSRERVLDVIQRALKSLVQGTPELGSTSTVLPNAATHDSTKPWRALVKGEGIILVVKDLTNTFQGYKELEAAGFPLSVFKDDAFMPIPGPIMPIPQAQAKFQLSLIPGGALLSVCILHHLTDGNGMNTITRALGEECTRAATIKGDLQPRVLETDRSVMASVNGGKTDIADHPAYNIVEDIFVPRGQPSDETPPQINGESTPPPPVIVHAQFHLSHERAQALKEYGSRDTPVSTHDAITALLWRNSIIARFEVGQLQKDQTTTFTVPHNGRRHLGLSKEWIGNCIYFIVAQATVSEILAPESLPVLAGRIRAALNRVDHALVEGMYTVRKQLPYSLNWWPLGIAHEPQIVAITSLYHSELLGTDWGPALGNVKHFTSTDIGALGGSFQRASYVGPKMPGGRGCNLHIGMLKQEFAPFRTDEVWQGFFSLMEL